MPERPNKPTKRGVPPADAMGDGRPDATSGDGSTDDDSISDDAPTRIYDSEPIARAKPAPIHAISMKTPAEPRPARSEQAERELPHVKLRAMSELARTQQPQSLGHLAPPYDPAEARARTVRDYIVWGSLAVILASVIALGVWFLGS